jgi:mitochondrial inner membrane protein COX18
MKTEEVVLPQLAQERPQILQRVHEEMRRDGFRGSREEAQREHTKRARPLVSTKDLFI